MPPNLLFYGDNLDILRNRIPTESVDLVYLDPPFNSNRSYNVLFGTHREPEAHAQIQAFDDTWTWTPETDRIYSQLLDGGVPSKVADALVAFHQLMGEGDVLAYLVMMAPRLVELRRVLKSTGSLYLHCDPTASHYLKILMDAVFGPTNFRSEIIWKRSSAHSDTKQGRRIHGHVHDVLLFYTKSNEWTWNPVYTPYDEEYVNQFYKHVEPETGRRYRLSDLTGPGGAAKGNPRYEVMGITRYWRFSMEKMQQLIKEGRVVQTKPGTVPAQKRYLDEMPGVPLQDVWTDVGPIGAQAAERLGYPTQKPKALLERVILTSSNPGDVVLDPFCGCGTTVDAAEALKRRWIGIDVTFIAVDLIRRRLEDTYGSEVQFVIDGIPRDVAGAEALFLKNPFDFERWAVSVLYGQPNEKQVGDKGFDGVIRFPLVEKGKSGRILISVKGGRQVNPAFVRDLVGTVQSQKAEMGVLVTLAKPTPGMKDAANHAGNYVWPVDNRAYPRIQLVTVGELFEGHRLKLPGALSPYTQATRQAAPSGQLTLGGSGA